MNTLSVWREAYVDVLLETSSGMWVLSSGERLNHKCYLQSWLQLSSELDHEGSNTAEWRKHEESDRTGRAMFGQVL